MSDPSFQLRFSSDDLKSRYDKIHDGFASTAELSEMPGDPAIQLLDQQYPPLEADKPVGDLELEESISKGLASRLVEMPNEWLAELFEHRIDSHEQSTVPRHQMVTAHLFEQMNPQHADANVARYADIVLSSKSKSVTKELVRARIDNWVNALSTQRRDNVKDAIIQKLHQKVRQTFTVDAWAASSFAPQDPNKLKDEVIGKLIDLLVRPSQPHKPGSKATDAANSVKPTLDEPKPPGRAKPRDEFDLLIDSLQPPGKKGAAAPKVRIVE